MPKRTRLAAYLRKTGASQHDFARRIGATGGMVCRYANGTRLPTVRYAVAIERETGGAVPATYWADLETRRAGA